MQQYLLSLLIIVPLAVASMLVFVPPASRKVFYTMSIVACSIQLLLLIGLLVNYKFDGTLQFMEQKPWITLDLGYWGVFQAQYFVAVDGLSLPLVALTVPVMLIATVSSRGIDKRVKGYFILMLILNAAIIGSFVALDFLLFYLFFEFMLLPMFFLIGIWGGSRREYASIKFFLYTLLGSILILMVMIGLYLSVHDPAVTGKTVHTFNLMHMSDPLNFVSNTILDPNNPWIIFSIPARTLAFVLLLIGFGIKLPFVPLHTWLPDAHVEAPTPVSVVLAALLLKIGAYGLLRIAYPVFPEAAIQLGWLVGLLGVIAIIYGALNAMASKDLKRLIAYSSVSHMGFVLLGIASLTTEGISGAIYQLVSHGIISALLFLIVGVLYDRTHDRTINNYSGLSQVMPVYFVIVLAAFFASLGLPGFSGFIAEVMVLLGAFKSQAANGVLSSWLAVVATSGLVLGASYYLWTIQRMFFGAFNLRGISSGTQLTDVSIQEKITLVPLVAAALIFGLYPQPLIDFINPFAEHFTALVMKHGEVTRTLTP